MTHHAYACPAAVAHLSPAATLCVQPRFRSLWERYCRGVQAIVYVVDAADHEAVKVGAVVFASHAVCNGTPGAITAAAVASMQWEKVVRN